MNRYQFPTCVLCGKPVDGVSAGEADEPATLRYTMHCHGAIETVDVEIGPDGTAEAPAEAFAGDRLR